MAHQEASLCLAFILLAGVWASTTAQSTDCSTVLVTMSPCLSYISGNATGPAADCCRQLGSVVGSRPDCLCQVLNGGGSNLGGLNINQTRALALPGACSVQTPSTSSCNGTSPTGSPGSTTPSSPNTNPGVVPNGGDGTSDANSDKLGASVLFSIVFVASYVASTFAMT